MIDNLVYFEMFFQVMMVLVLIKVVVIIHYVVVKITFMSVQGVLTIAGADIIRDIDTQRDSLAD